MVGNDRLLRLSNGSLSAARAQPNVGAVVALAASAQMAVAAPLPSLMGVEQSPTAGDSERELMSYKNVVPAYRDKPLPSVGELFSCPGCADVFALAESLVDHLQRKAMLVTLPCANCHRKRYFYNKCLAYAHIRLHFPDAAVPKLESIVAGSSVMKYGMMPRSVSQELQQLEETVESLVESRRYRLDDRTKDAAANQPTGCTAITTVTATVAESTSAPSPTIASPAAAAAAVPSSIAVAAAATLPSAAQTTSLGSAGSSSCSSVSSTAGGSNSSSLIVAAAAAASPPVPVRLFRCIECSEQFADQPNLQLHFGRPQRGVALTLRNVCAVPRCGKAFFSPCALKAHMRFHAGQRPFVCPECACVVPGEYAVFEKHVLFKCHHRSRLLEYSCAVCVETFDTLSRLQEHWSAKPQHCLMAHYDHLCKCSVCPLAFKSEELFAGHASGCRGSVAVHVYVCRACTAVFRSYDELSSHNVATHRLDLNQKRPATASYLYRCEPCRAVAEALASVDSRGYYFRGDVPKFKNLQAYDAHLRQEHGRTVIAEMCDVCGVEFRTPELLAGHLEAVHSSGSGLIVCVKSTATPSKVILSAPVQTSTGLSSKQSAVVPALPASHRLQQEHCPPSGQPPIKVKTEVSRGSPGTLLATSQAVITTTSQPLPFACHLCGRRFAAYVKLREHSFTVHNSLGQLLECWLCNEKNVSHKSIHSWAMMDKHLMDVHKLTIDSCTAAAADQQQLMFDSTKKKVEPAAGDFAGGDEPPAKKAVPAIVDDGSSRFYVAPTATADCDTERQCSRCGFSSRLRVEFVQHIKKHGADGELCLECGMCFPVEAALRRHLFVAHRVQDMAAYLRVHRPATADFGGSAGGTAAAPTSRSSANGSIVASSVADSDGRCRVCSRRFETEAALRTHVRSHGMAFINAKRAQNNVKSGSSEDDSGDQASSGSSAVPP